MPDLVNVEKISFSDIEQSRELFQQLVETKTSQGLENVIDFLAQLEKISSKVPFFLSKLHSKIGSALNSISSTIPTMAASTGVSFRAAAILAELPLTIKTTSPKPASTGNHNSSCTLLPRNNVGL